MKDNYLEYYNEGTKEILPEDFSNEMLLYYPEQRGYSGRDIIYQGLNVEMVLAFLSGTKIKPNGKLYSQIDRRKYADAILWGAGTVAVKLNSRYSVMIDKFLSDYQKEYTKAKGDGNVEENAADAIPFSLYVQLLEWSLEEHNIFVWV